jgi:hypothetical protein
MAKTALQQLIEFGEKMMEDHPPKVLSFAEAIDKAEELQSPSCPGDFLQFHLRTTNYDPFGLSLVRCKYTTI